MPAQTFSQGTLSASRSFMWLPASQSETERERTWQLLCFQTAVGNWCVSVGEVAPWTQEWGAGRRLRGIVIWI